MQVTFLVLSNLRKSCSAGKCDHPVAYFGSLLSIVDSQFQAGKMTGYDVQRTRMCVTEYDHMYTLVKSPGLTDIDEESAAHLLRRGSTKRRL
jgi:hypothetical protein